MHSARSRRAQRRTSQVLGLSALIPIFGLLLATSAYADLTTATGSAFGEQIHVGVINSGPLPTITAPAGGTNSLVSVNVPGLLQSGFLTVSSNATTGPSGSVSSTANATNVTVGSALITASTLASQCHSDSTGRETGSATVGTVTVGGSPVSVNTASNTTVAVPGLGTATFNEQITGGNSITVNALHIHLTGILGNGDIIIAQSRCSATASGVQVPAGTFGGVLLTGLVALAFGGYQLTSGRLRRRTVTSPTTGSVPAVHDR